MKCSAWAKIWRPTKKLPSNPRIYTLKREIMTATKGLVTSLSWSAGMWLCSMAARISTIQFAGASVNLVTRPYRNRDDVDRDEDGDGGD